MTKKRDFKSLVRERMAKTGERYAAARAQVLAKVSAGETPGVLPGYGPCGGLQSETAPLCNVLRHAGVRAPNGEPYGEALVHGLCGGIGFLYAVFEYAGFPPMLTIVGRARSMPDAFVAEGARRVGARASVHETSSAKQARAALDSALDAGRAALCTVDAAALPYLGVPDRMLGMGPHVVAVIGRRGDDVWVDDRGARPMQVSPGALARARGGYRNGKHRLTTFEPRLAREFDLAESVRDAIRFTARAYDDPPAKSFQRNVGSAGLAKWADLLARDDDKKAWSRVFASGKDAYVGLRRAYDCTQHEYAAPDAGRPLYADFLDEACALTGAGALAGIAQRFRESGRRFRELARLIAEDAGPEVAEGCAVSDRRAELLDAAPGDVHGEMAELWRQRFSLGESCALTASQAKDVYRRMSGIVRDIEEIERDAVAALGAATTAG